METFDVYQDIMERTNGDIYLGVVGPVRTGKSTFIKRFMEYLVLPNIADENRRARVIDELPQSADGKTIMTTEPKFVPDGGVKVDFGDELSANIRLIDSVGYIVKDAEGYSEGESERLVSTPWSEDKMPFREAGEFGTRKVIEEHSTVGIIVTCDGSISTLPRASYIESESRVIADMKEYGKPFVIVLNTKNPNSKQTKELRCELANKYNVEVIAMNVLEMTKQDADNVLKEVLLEFPIKNIEIEVPNFLEGLSIDNEVIASIVDNMLSKSSNMSKMSEYKLLENIEDNEYIDSIVSQDIDFGKGIITYELRPKDSLFYNVISMESGVEIKSDSDLIGYIKRLSKAESVFEKVGGALDEVDKLGYSIIKPKLDEVELSSPTLYKKGNKCQVKLVAKTSTLHVMKVNMTSEICPIMGSEEQCNEMIEYINNEAKDNSYLDVNLFNKPLKKMVEDEIEMQVASLTEDTKCKMQKTVERIVNEGKGGVLCVLI